MLSKSKNFSMAIVSALTLSACGGGSNDMTSPSPNSIDTDKNIKTYSKNDVTGSVFAARLVSGKHVLSPDQLTRFAAGSNEKTVVIDGKVFDLATLSPNTTEISTASVKNMSYSSYGLIVKMPTPPSPVDVTTDFLFEQGVSTPDSAMPTSGMANYLGTAVVTDITTQTTRTDYDSNFNINFAKKRVFGALSRDGLPTVYLGADISGSSFSGSDDKVYTKGSFHGPNAEELTGIFRDDKQKLMGVYGAEKQYVPNSNE